MLGYIFQQKLSCHMGPASSRMSQPSTTFSKSASAQILGVQTLKFTRLKPTVFTNSSLLPRPNQILHAHEQALGKLFHDPIRLFLAPQLCLSRPSSMCWPMVQPMTIFVLNPQDVKAHQSKIQLTQTTFGLSKKLYG